MAPLTEVRFPRGFDVELGDAFLVYAKTDGKLSMVVVEKGMRGFSLGQQIKNKLGMRSSGTAELVFEDVEVPACNRIGEEGKAALCMVRESRKSEE